jgi:hypothetical protein
MRRQTPSTENMGGASFSPAIENLGAHDGGLRPHSAANRAGVLWRLALWRLGFFPPRRFIYRKNKKAIPSGGSHLRVQLPDYGSLIRPEWQGKSSRARRSHLRVQLPDYDSCSRPE